MALLSDLFGGGGGIKSIQRGTFIGTITTTAAGVFMSYTNITIAAVDTTKCVLHVLGAVGNSYSHTHKSAGTSSNAYGYEIMADLTSATNLRVGTQENTSTAGYRRYASFSWQVVEYA